MMIHNTLKHLSALFFSVCLLVNLTSCGGGGSGGGGTKTSSSSSLDSTPNAITFAPVTNAAVSTDIASAPVTISGINQSVSISVIGGSYSVGGGAFTSATVTVTNGQVVTVKVKSSDKTNTPVTATLTIGGVSGAFVVTTVPDVMPDAFTFTPATGAGAKVVTTSNEITVTGIDISAPISIAAEADVNAEYSVNGGAFTNAAGTVNKDQKVIVRATSSDKPATPVTAVLTIGGAPGNFVVTTKADEAAPTAQILFPPPVSMTEGNTILVRGSASDEFSDIASVKVNGVTATTTDGFKNWQALVPLSDSSSPVTATTENTVIVSTEDGAGNRSADVAHVAVIQARLNITSFPDSDNPFRYVWGMVIDRSSGNNRLLVTDETNKIISVDLNTAKRTVFSTVEMNCQLRGITINPIDNRLYTGCYNNKIFDFDLLDSSNLQEHSSSLFNESTSLIWHRFGDGYRVVSVNSSTGSIVTFDPSFSDGKTLSDATKSIPNNLNPISRSLAGIAYDKNLKRYLVSDYLQQTIFSVDAVTGERVIFSNNSIGTGAPFGLVDSAYISGVAIDDTNNRLLVTEVPGNLFSVDLVTGDRTLISSTTSSNSSNALDQNYVVSLAEPNTYVFVSDYTLSAIYAIDLVTGYRVIVTKN